MKLLLKRVFLCVAAVGSAHAGWAQDWEHIRVIGQRLGLPRVVNIGSPPSQTIAIGDFDGDGDADIAVSGAGARRVTVLLGDASSPFTASLVAPRTDWPTVDADTAVAGVDYRIQSSPLSAMTTVMSPGDIREGRPESLSRRGRGRRLRIPASRTPVIAGDFDADGVVEITAGPRGSSALAIGDFDADGFADLVASTEGSTSLTLRFGDAQRRFSTLRMIDVGVITAPAGLAAGDINDDGVSDVALLGDSDTFRQECALGCELRAPRNGSTFRDVCATAGPFPVGVNPKLLVSGNESVATLQLNAAARANSSGTLSSMTVLGNTIPNIPTPIPAGATTATAKVLTARVRLSPVRADRRPLPDAAATSLLVTASGGSPSPPPPPPSQASETCSREGLSWGSDPQRT